jgi:hypothetical protein
MTAEKKIKISNNIYELNKSKEHKILQTPKSAKRYLKIKNKIIETII